MIYFSKKDTPVDIHSFRSLSRWSDSTFFLLLILAGIGLASGYFAFLYPYQPGFDEIMYLDNSHVLMSFQKGVMCDWHLNYSFYSFCIGIVQEILGLGRWGIKLLNLLMHLAMSFLVFHFVGRCTGNMLLGYIAMTLAGFAPSVLYASGMILTETIFTLLLVLTSIWATKVLNRDRFLTWIAGAPLLTVLSLTRPTGYGLAIALSIVGTGFFLIKRPSLFRILAVNAWVPVYFLAILFYTKTYQPVTTFSNSSIGLSWVVMTTYVTNDGDSYDAVRDRQAEFALHHSDNHEIAEFASIQRSQLLSKIMEEIGPGYGLPAETKSLREIPFETLASIFFRNLVGHPFHLLQHFAVNAFWNMWFARDSLRSSFGLFLVVFPYLIWGFGGLWILFFSRRWLELGVLSTIILTLWSMHTILYAVARFSTPLLPLLSILGTLGIAEWLKRNNSNFRG
jgi:hypothetical protein